MMMTNHHHEQPRYAIWLQLPLHLLDTIVQYLNYNHLIMLEMTGNYDIRHHVLPKLRVWMRFEAHVHVNHIIPLLKRYTELDRLELCIDFKQSSHDLLWLHQSASHVQRLTLRDVDTHSLPFREMNNLNSNHDHPWVIESLNNHLGLQDTLSIDLSAYQQLHSLTIIQRPHGFTHAIECQWPFLTPRLRPLIHVAIDQKLSDDQLFNLPPTLTYLECGIYDDTNLHVLPSLLHHLVIINCLVQTQPLIFELPHTLTMFQWKTQVEWLEQWTDVLAARPSLHTLILPNVIFKASCFKRTCIALNQLNFFEHNMRHTSALPAIPSSSSSLSFMPRIPQSPTITTMHTPCTPHRSISAPLRESSSFIPISLYTHLPKHLTKLCIHVSTHQDDYFSITHVRAFPSSLTYLSLPFISASRRLHQHDGGLNLEHLHQLRHLAFNYIQHVDFLKHIIYPCSIQSITWISSIRRKNDATAHNQWRCILLDHNELMDQPQYVVHLEHLQPLMSLKLARFNIQHLNVDLDALELLDQLLHTSSIQHMNNCYLNQQCVMKSIPN